MPLAAERDERPEAFRSPARPFVLGIGGTTRPGSSSERALLAALAVARKHGADTVALTGEDLCFPMYSQDAAARTPAVLRYVDLVRRCDGLIIASPGYHGSVSGLIKNALDYIEDLRAAPRPYLSGRAVGCIVCAAGWQAIGTTLTSLRAIVHSLRGWPTPLGAGLNLTELGDRAETALSERTPHPHIANVAREVTHFAQLQRTGSYERKGGQPAGGFFL